MKFNFFWEITIINGTFYSTIFFILKWKNTVLNEYFIFKLMIVIIFRWNGIIWFTWKRKRRKGTHSLRGCFFEGVKMFYIHSNFYRIFLIIKSTRYNCFLVRPYAFGFLTVISSACNYYLIAKKSIIVNL